MADGDRAPYRLAVLTRDCVYADAALKRLSASPALSIVGLMRSVRPFKDCNGPLATLAAFNRLCGARYTAHLVATSVSIPGLSGWRGLAAWGRQLGTPVRSTADVNDDASARFIAACRPDLVLCVDFNHIVRQPLIESALGRRFFNVHPSLLPRHRGHDPVFHAMLAGETVYGVTIHALASKVDTGEMLAQQEVDVTGLPLARRYVRLFEAGADAFVAAAEAGEAGFSMQPQKGEPSSHTYPTREEVRAFLAAGHRL